jgi:AraC-like DNA-binding protein
MKEIFETIFMLASVQGILLTAFLLTGKRNHLANRILASATLFLSLDLIFSVYYLKGWYREYPHLTGISYPFPLLYGPLFYLYAKYVSKRSDKFKKYDLLHFLPAIIVYLVCAPEYLYTAGQKVEFASNMIRGIYPAKFAVFHAVLPVQGIIYTLLTFKIVREYDKRIRNIFSNIDLISLNWLKYIAFSGLAVWTIVALLSYVRILRPVLNGSIQISMSVLIYMVAYKGLKQPEIFFSISAGADMHGQTLSEKYKRSGLSDRTAEEIGKKLTDFMVSEKPYLDDELSMQKLADMMQISNHNLSEVINTRLKLSYYDFINNYRIEEFKRRIADPSNDRFNILSIAYDSGFKSKGTFNSIFKKNTGITPSEYKSRINSPSK